MPSGMATRNKGVSIARILSSACSRVCGLEMLKSVALFLLPGQTLTLVNILPLDETRVDTQVKQGVFGELGNFF